MRHEFILMCHTSVTVWMRTFTKCEVEVENPQLDFTLCSHAYINIGLGTLWNHLYPITERCAANEYKCELTVRRTCTTLHSYTAGATVT